MHKGHDVITLGINAAFHDSSAALVIDGQLIAAAEEERFSRIKHAKRPVPFSAWELPFNAIDFCLAQAGLRLPDVEHVAYSFDPVRFADGRIDFNDGEIELPLSPSARRYSEWDNPWDPLFVSHIVNAPRQLADGAPHHLRTRLRGVRHDGPFTWHNVSHHLAHQASACLAAPFERCAVLTLDGRGERATTTYGRYRHGRYEAMGEVQMPHSLGLLYEQVTTHLGFLHSSDEYKVMALAAMGEPRYARKLKQYITVRDNGQYTLAGFDAGDMFGPPRRRGEPIGSREFDVAASLQVVLEDTVLQLARWLGQASGERYLAMAGGVALNCVMNAKLRDAGLFDAVWVQPAAGDAGTALGAALWVDARVRATPLPAKQRQPAPRRAVAVATTGADDDADVIDVEVREPQSDAAPAFDLEHGPLAPRRWTMTHAYWGPSFTDAQIERHLKWAKLPYRRLANVAEETARILAEDRIIGWFQGRMEFGPRALGARSILASPRSAAMQQRLNELKDREDFRPVAPAVPIECMADWFMPATANGGASPFMLFIYDVRPEQAARIPAACHSDRTARVQTVARDSHPQFHALLTAFGRLTGVPVLVNTSFNVRGEPVVCSPSDALHAYFSTPLDALVIGSFLLEKPRSA
jgi:carbamoyltransferase